MTFNTITESQTTLTINSSKTTINGETSETKNNVDEELADYDPYKQAHTGKTSSYVEALFILIKASLGTGILGMPRAFYNSGYILGMVGTIFAGILTTVTVHMISSTEYELCKKKRVPRLTYPETITAAFEHGPKSSRRFKTIAGRICYAYLILLEFGGDCVYAIFIAVNIKGICDYQFGERDLRFYLLCLLIPLILMCWVKDLKYLAPGSTLGTGCAIACIGVIYFYIFSQPLSIEGKRMTGSLKEFALFFGTVLFALGAFGIVMPLKNSMTKPRQFDSSWGVVNTAMIPNVFLYIVMGLFGYIAYGEHVRGSITLNLPQVGFVGDLIRFLLAASIFTTYPLPNYVVTELLWHGYLKLRFADNKHLDKWEYIFRTCLTCTNFLACVAIPNLELFMSLVGSLCLPMLAMWFPTIIHTLTFWDQYKGFKFVLFILRAVIITLTGFFAFFVSFSSSVYEIVTTVF